MMNYNNTSSFYYRAYNCDKSFASKIKKYVNAMKEIKTQYYRIKKYRKGLTVAQSKLCLLLDC